MRKIVFLFMFMVTTMVAFAQTYDISTSNGQTVSTCSGLFYDSGGQAGFYSANESYSITICPSTPGTYISLDFSSWDVSGSAQMEVFDGPNNTANSFGTFTATGFNPVAMGASATPTNASGCLTIEWTSGTQVDMGWEAEISCVIPCQTVLADLISSSPSINSDGFIDICPGDTVSFFGGGLYPENNLVYGQSNATSSFVWNYGNGMVDSSMSNYGQAVYDSVAGYFVNLTVFDSMECQSSNVLAIRIRVGTEPTFSGTLVQDPVICDGEETILDGEAQTHIFEVSAELSLAGTTFLPDGSGQSYTTSLVFDAFSAGQTLTNVTDFLSICAVMEHSYLGDLDITLTCPNGTTVFLHEYPACGGTFLGVPIDDDTNLNPGVGWEYCWSPVPTYGTMASECGSMTTMAAGSYAAVGSLANFVGCPLNGAWTIEVTDNLNSDNGYIFEWGVNFNPNILPANFDYEPQIIAHDWNVSPSVVVADSGQDMTVAPGVGTYSYTYSVTDDFGCTYDTVVGLEVLPSFTANFPEDTIICSDATIALDASNNGQNNGAEYVWYWDGTGSDTISVADNYLVDKPGFYWVVFPNAVPGCGHNDSILVEYNEMELDLGGDVTGVCSTNPVQLDATTPMGTYPNLSYSWSTGDAIPVITATASGTYSVSVARGHCVEVDEIYVDYDIPLNINLGGSAWLCDGSVITLDAGYTDENYLWSTGGQTQFLDVSIPGTYSLTISNACGQFTDQIDVVGMTLPTADLGGDASICNGTSHFMDAQYNGPGPMATYQWSDGSNLPGLAANVQGLYSVTVTNQCGDAVDNMHLTVENPLLIELGGNQILCPGDILTLDAGFENVEYYWSNGETTQTIDVTTPDSYGVDVTNSCGVFSDFITVTLDPIVVDLGVDTTLCPGGSIDINAYNPGSNFSWSNGETTQTITVTQAGTYSVNVVSANNCNDSDEIEVVLFEGEVDLGDNVGVCDGSSETLDAGFPGFTYNWSTGATTQTIEVLDAGNYAVTVNHFCGDLYDQVEVSLNPLPVVDLGADTIFISSEQTATIDAGAGVAYAWSSGENTQVITTNVAGDYTVTVTDENGCQGTASVYVYQWAVGIDETTFDQSVRIFPNPARDYLVIASENQRLSAVEVYNSLGEIVLRENGNGFTFKIDLNTLSEGVYFARISSAKGETVVQPVSVVK